MADSSRTASYYIFLIKLWPERSHDNGETISWRFSIEDPVSGVRKGFTDQESLLTHLREQLDTIAVVTA